MSTTLQKPRKKSAIHFEEGTADIVKLVPIRNLDLTSLSYPGTKGIKHERPVKGFRTQFDKPAAQNTNIVRNEWKIRNYPHSQTSSRRATPHHSQRHSKDVDAESQASGGTDGSGISRTTKTSRATTVSSLKSTRRIISVKTTERKPFYEPLQLLRTGTTNETSLKGEVYLVPGPRDATNPKEDPRQTVNMPTVSVPRKGLIKLTGLPYEIDNPEYFDNRKERSEQRERVRRWLELMGPPLPSTPGGALKSCLIRDRTMIKQVKHGAKQLKAEEAVKERDEATEKLLDSLVNGLLQYETPEVPNINKNMQTFVSVQPDVHPLNILQRSHTALGTTHRDSMWHPKEAEPDSLTDHPLTHTLRHSEAAYRNYIASPRTGYDDHSSRGNSAAALYYPRLETSQRNKRIPRRNLAEMARMKLDDQYSLHYVLANARKFHLRRLGDLPRDTILGLLGRRY